MHTSNPRRSSQCVIEPAGHADRPVPCIDWPGFYCGYSFVRIQYRSLHRPFGYSLEGNIRATSGYRAMPLIGEPIVRQEDARLLRGQGRFVDDVHIDGMLHAALFRSAWPHGRIRNIDVAAAAALPGIVGVFTLPDFSASLRPIRSRIAAMPGFEKFLQLPLATRQGPICRRADGGCGRDQSLRRRGRAVADFGRDRGAAAGAELGGSREGRRRSSTRRPAPIIPASRSAAATPRRRSGHAPYVRRESFQVQRHTAVPMETRGLVAVWDEAKAA